MYDPDTGHFYWIKAKRGRPEDQQAGYVTHQGYRKIRFGNNAYIAHRLAYFYMTGEWPTDYVGFKDNNPQNLTWNNLVLKTKEEVYGFVKTRLRINYDEDKEKQKKKSSITKTNAKFSEEDVEQAILKFLEAHE